MRRKSTLRLVLPVLLLAGSTNVAGAQTARVLLVYDEPLDLLGMATIDAGLSTALIGQSPVPLDIHREVLELSRFDSAPYRASFREHLRLKYANSRPDVIVAVMGPALSFVLGQDDPLFRGTPILFAGIDLEELGERRLPATVTGVRMVREFAPTVDIALRLHPETERFVFVSGSSDFDLRLTRDARAEFEPYQDSHEFIYLSGMSLNEMLHQVSMLPPRSVVLYSTVLRDGAGESFVPHEVAERVSAASNSPVYGFVDQFLGRGVVGGHMYSLGTHAEHAADLVLRVLAGEDPSSIPIVDASSSQTLFDARQLRRWDIAESQLPEDAIVLMREPSFWSLYRRYALAAAAVMLLQMIVIGALLIQRAKRRKAENDLRDSESRFRVVADSAPLMIWMSSADGQLRYFNRAWLDFVGRQRNESFSDRWVNSIHPEDLERFTRTFVESQEHGARFTIEHRLRRFDGVYRWVLCTGVPRLPVSGEARGFIGSYIDITARKEAEFEREQHRAELAHLNRLAAMAELTASVAHEVNQPLSAILMNAATARRLLNRSAASAADVGPMLADIQSDSQRAAEIIKRMRTLLQKHEMVTAPVAINRIIGEVLQLISYEAERRAITVLFEAADNLPPVLGDRVHLQQVMMNLILNGFDSVTAAHGEIREIRIRTDAVDAESVRISVTDSGPGIPEERMPHLFEPFFSTKREGLGLGLSITRTIVEAHWGAVWAESDGMGGATFHVELPSIWYEGNRTRLAEKRPGRRGCSALNTREPVRLVGAPE